MTRVVLLLLIAILPIRVVAAAMPSLCAEGHSQAAEQRHDHQDHGSPQHHQNQNDSKSALGHDCGFCAKHCHGASFVLSADRQYFPAAPAVDAIAFHAWLAAGFVPDRLDRPPLYL
jgi:hypothetical protein